MHMMDQKARHFNLSAFVQVLIDQPDHNTWATQDVFALSIVVIELLTYGMFTYPYKKDTAAPSYAHLLLFELEVYNLLLKELSSVYDVSVMKGRLDRKIKHWKDRIPDPIDAAVCVQSSPFLPFKPSQLIMGFPACVETREESSSRWQNQALKRFKF